MSLQFLGDERLLMIGKRAHGNAIHVACNDISRLIVFKAGVERWNRDSGVFLDIC